MHRLPKIPHARSTGKGAHASLTTATGSVEDRRAAVVGLKKLKAARFGRVFGAGSLCCAGPGTGVRSWLVVDPLHVLWRK